MMTGYVYEKNKNKIGLLPLTKPQNQFKDIKDTIERQHYKNYRRDNRTVSL